MLLDHAPHCWRRAFARWLAALVLSAAFGPVVSGALLQRAAGDAAAQCAVHAAHGMECDADVGAPLGDEGHCGLCLLALHPPVLEAPPQVSAAHDLEEHGRTRLALATHPALDRTRRWMTLRHHAPPA